MNAPHDTRRRGIALLLVLAVLILVMAAAVSLVHAASSERLRRTLVVQNATADDLLGAADAPIEDWLRRHASEIVMPVDSQDPQVSVLFDAWSAGDLEHELRITAWDQCGMIGHDSARLGSTLRRAVPPDVLRLLDRVRIERGDDPGLDLFLSHVRDYERIEVFPEPAPADANTIGGQSGGEPPESGPAQGELPAERPPGLGAWVATHNPGSLNVNTAPMDLVEAALRRAGRRGMLELVQAARSSGEAATLTGNGMEDSKPDPPRRRQGTLALVSGSTAWAFRIDVRVGMVRRSWWSVYRVSAESGQPTWECVQRLAVPS